MRYGVDNYGACHACGEYAELCLDCDCCEHCCGNGFICPSEEPEPEAWEEGLFENYCEGN